MRGSSTRFFPIVSRSTFRYIYNRALFGSMTTKYVVLTFLSVDAQKHEYTLLRMITGTHISTCTSCTRLDEGNPEVEKLTIPCSSFWRAVEPVSLYMVQLHHNKARQYFNTIVYINRVCKLTSTIFYFNFGISSKKSKN